jgi:hypothetical protein
VGSVAALMTRMSSALQRLEMAVASRAMPSGSVRSTGAIVALPPA